MKWIPAFSKRTMFIYFILLCLLYLLYALNTCLVDERKFNIKHIFLKQHISTYKNTAIRLATLLGFGVSSDVNKYRRLRPSGAPRRRLPDALIIGVKKCGTRALLEFLRLHPDVRAAGSEVHFFDKFYHKGFEWYRQRMPATLEGQLTMEKTPSYWVTRSAPRRVHAMNPAVRLLAVVRDPVTRAVSDYTQSARRSVTTRSRPGELHPVTRRSVTTRSRPGELHPVTRRSVTTRSRPGELHPVTRRSVTTRSRPGELHPVTRRSVTTRSRPGELHPVTRRSVTTRSRPGELHPVTRRSVTTRSRPGELHPVTRRSVTTRSRPGELHPVTRRSVTTRSRPGELHPVTRRSVTTRSRPGELHPVTRRKRPSLPRFEQLALVNSTHNWGVPWSIVDATWGPVRLGVYARPLRRWLRRFPRRRLLLVSGERLVADPAAEMARVQEFLGLKKVITEKHFYFNSTKGFPCLLKSETSPTPHCLGKTKGRSHPHIDPSAIERLREFYRPYNERFYELSGINFGWP
ncbi:unnamed protein product [Plutella xylostella]|uniref:(diamondback moth) hypothetical protein n=1 Tax=Plutella xylostella TaxID=51655 RepID=A0A8S4DDM2_PLUXY|nr:unnamed protein product [Plutella xylostella]